VRPEGREEGPAGGRREEENINTGEEGGVEDLRKGGKEGVRERGRVEVRRRGEEEDIDAAKEGVPYLSRNLPVSCLVPPPWLQPAGF